MRVTFLKESQECDPIRRIIRRRANRQGCLRDGEGAARLENEDKQVVWQKSEECSCRCRAEKIYRPHRLTDLRDSVGDTRSSMLLCFSLIKESPPVTAELVTYFTFWGSFSLSECVYADRILSQCSVSSWI